MISVDLLVLRCVDVERSRAFYELIGITFVREQHGTGPEHLAAVLGGVTIELYPASSTRPPEAGLRIGLKVEDVDAVVRILVGAGHHEREGGRSSIPTAGSWSSLMDVTTMADRSDAALSQFREAAIDWATGGRGQPLLDAAAQAIADGLDSPTLRVLAGAPRASADDEAWELAPDVFEELGLEIPERMSDAAYIAGAVLLGKRFLDGQGTERDVAKHLSAMFVSAGYPNELANFSGLDDMYDMLDTGVIAGSIDDVDRSTVECVQRLCSPGALDERPEIAELVRRSFLAGEVSSE